MTSAAKLHKDKLYCYPLCSSTNGISGSSLLHSYVSTPRITPKGTAASIARSARNAASRNLSSGTASKSPSKITCKPKPEAKGPTLTQNEPHVDEKLMKRPSDKDVTKVASLEQLKIADEQVAATLPAADLVEVCTTDMNVPMELGTEDQSNVDDGESIDGHGKFSDATRSIKDDDIKLEMNIDSNQFAGYESEKSDIAYSSNVSRPQTPKGGRSNISRSPRVSSRPTTPAKKTTRPTANVSRPDTPRHASLPRPRTSSVFKPPQTTSKANNGPDDITVAYSTKQKEFHCLKKELDLKQKATLETFNMLKSLRDRMIKEGKIGQGESFNHQELAIFNVADWAAEELAQLCHHSEHGSEGAGEIINTFLPIDEELLSKWESKVLCVPNSFADLCFQAFTTRQEAIDWIKTILANQDAVSEEDISRIATFNKQGVELCDILRDVKTRADESLHGVTQLLKQTCQERGILITVGESLVKEMAHLQKEKDMLTTAAELNIEPETAKALEDIRRELEDERAAKTTIKDKLSSTESQLRQARIRVNKMDRQLREAEASIASLTGTVKSLEDQSRQKEVQLEARARKLKESLKTGEMTNSHIMQEREALQNELLNLKEQLERSMVENKLTIQDLNSQLKQLKSALETERSKKLEEMKMKSLLEESNRVYLNTIDDLKVHIEELESKKHNPDLPTEKEIELRAELVATKETLRIAEEEMIACKREKVRFMETLGKIAEAENRVGMQQKMAELLNKEELMSKMQIQIHDLTKSIKLNEQKVIQYEQYIRDMQVYNQATENGNEDSNTFTFQELQQEIMHLRMRLLEAVHRNEDLTEALMQKDQQLEQQNKTSHAQAMDIKVREELINMLQNKETEQSRELSVLQQDLANRMKIVEEVNKQIAAKADEIQELFSSLENKQQQIHRLEKIVLALEEQQRRAQAQRTRQEEKIAALEHELAGGNNRERLCNKYQKKDGKSLAPMNNLV